jgi:hypothetical protein
VPVDDDLAFGMVGGKLEQRSDHMERSRTWMTSRP